MSWKEQLAKAYTTVPNSWKEFAWKASVAMMAITSTLTGFYMWKNPQILIGIPSERQSPVERLAGNDSVRQQVYQMMERYFTQPPIRSDVRLLGRSRLNGGSGCDLLTGSLASPALTILPQT